MKPFSGSMITQQMYTRERRGVYRSAEGFDTVAKSESLDNPFVKKILHPFCVYDAPAELTARGEREEAAYPPAIHLFHTENGETVIGRSRYQTTDFTGQRSAFFAHNYIVPASRSEEILQHAADWLQADFADRYDGELGGALPELPLIPVSAQRRSRREDLIVLQQLGIEEGLFKALLQAVMTAVGGKKKIYIALDVPIGELSARAVELTAILYRVLPYEFRRRLGVITYANEPKSRKYIHLSFVEKGSIRQGDRSIEKDFTFDLATGRIGNAVDAGNTRAGFAELAWKRLAQGADLEDFAQFADSMLAGDDGERRLSLAAYNELAVFYEIEQGNEALYTDNKSAVLSGLLSYLKADGALDSRVRLNDIFLERFDREFDLIRQKGEPVPAVMESFKEYYLLKGHTYKGKIVDYFINGMLNSRFADHPEVVSAAYEIIESNEELNTAFFKKVLTQSVFRDNLLEPYLEERLAAAPKAAGVIHFVIQWGRTLPEALDLPVVLDSVQDYLIEKLQREQEPVAAVAAIHEMVDKVEKERRKSGGIPHEVLALLQKLASSADRFLLNRISLENMTQEQLLDISFVRYPGGVVDWNPPLDLITKQKANALRAAYRWFGEEKPSEIIFAELTPQELDTVQLLGRRWLREARSLEPFDRLPLAFYHSGGREGGPLEYESLLELVKRKVGADKETVYRFLAWTEGNPLFCASSKKFYPAYRRAILKYFLGSDREAFKNREFRKTYVAQAGPALQSVYKEAHSQLASPLARWIGRSRFQLLISGSIMGILIIAAVIVFSMMRKDDPDLAMPEASPQPTPVHTAVSEPAPATVYLKNNSSGEQGGTRLLFAFSSAEECAQFNPEEIAVIHSEGKEDTYPIAAMTRACTLPSPAAGEDSPASDDRTDPALNNGNGEEGSPAVTAEGSAGDSNAPAASPEGAASAGASPVEETGTPLPGASSEAPVDKGNQQGFEVEVMLEPDDILKTGVMIQAGDYKLIVLDDPGAGGIAGTGSEVGESAGASPTPAP